MAATKALQLVVQRECSLAEMWVGPMAALLVFHWAGCWDDHSVETKVVHWAPKKDVQMGPDWAEPTDEYWVELTVCSMAAYWAEPKAELTVLRSVGYSEYSRAAWSARRMAERKAMRLVVHSAASWAVSKASLRAATTAAQSELSKVDQKVERSEVLSAERRAVK